MLYPHTIYNHLEVCAHLPFMYRVDGLVHCMDCGNIYDGNAQCDCWKWL